MLAQAMATATPTATASTAVSSGGGTDLKSVVVGAAIAALALMLGQALTHVFTARRDRRTQLADAIDKAIASFVAGDRAMLALMGAVRKEPHRIAHPGMQIRDPREDEIRERAERLTDHEVSMQAAVLSLSIRLPFKSRIARHFMNANVAFFSIRQVITEVARPDIPTAKRWRG